MQILIPKEIGFEVRDINKSNKFVFQAYMNKLFPLFTFPIKNGKRI